MSILYKRVIISRNRMLVIKCWILTYMALTASNVWSTTSSLFHVSFDSTRIWLFQLENSKNQEVLRPAIHVGYFLMKAIMFSLWKLVKINCDDSRLYLSMYRRVNTITHRDELHAQTSQDESLKSLVPCYRFYLAIGLYCSCPVYSEGSKLNSSLHGCRDMYLIRIVESI